MPIIHKRGGIRYISLLQRKQKIKPIPVAEFLRRKIKQSDKTLIVGPGKFHQDPSSAFIGKNIGTKNMVLIDIQKDSRENPKYAMHGGIYEHQEMWRRRKKILGLPEREPERILGNAVEMPFKPNSFDKIVDHCTLEFMGTPYSVVLKEYLRVLKPHGKAFIFSEDNYLKNLSMRPAEKRKKQEEERGIIESKLKAIDSNIKVEVIQVTDKPKDYGSLSTDYDYIHSPASYVFVISKPK